MGWQPISVQRPCGGLPVGPADHASAANAIRRRGLPRTSRRYTTRQAREGGQGGRGVDLGAAGTTATWPCFGASPGTKRMHDALVRPPPILFSRSVDFPIVSQAEHEFLAAGSGRRCVCSERRGPANGRTKSPRFRTGTRPP
ncbi:hypothetical protein KM043_006528 [Ampulex compressa]|nr:hypothetical protein KM043_006528 [Ampulex compressa]